jgi:hypothetical protein
MEAGNLNQIVSALAEVALTPAMWTNALDAVSNETGANGAVLLPSVAMRRQRFPTPPA